MVCNDTSLENAFIFFFFDFNTRFYFFVIKYCFKSLPQIFILISDGPIEIFNRSLNTLDVIVFKLPCIKMC